jgi:RsiW-degrading membrane proteinase PrsW (M82 family)
MGFFASVFFGFVPMFAFAWFVYWLDRYEKEPKILLGVVFVWGAVVAAGVAYVINTTLARGVYLMTASETITEFATGSLFAPPVEEILKGMAVLLVFLIFRREFDSILDGIVYAGIVALGFAATENSYYIYNFGYREDGWMGLLFLVFVRVILVGWQHPFYTAFVGIGFATARLNRNWGIKLIVPFIGLAVAIFAHSMHNTLASLLSGVGGLLVGTFVDWSGWLLMFLVIIWAIYREQRRLRDYLREEVVFGVISPTQYRTACSARAQFGARTAAFFDGQFRETGRFYHICAELAHKKHQRATLGEEGGNTQIIIKLRDELAGLSRLVKG